MQAGSIRPQARWWASLSLTLSKHRLRRAEGSLSRFPFAEPVPRAPAVAPSPHFLSGPWLSLLRHGACLTEWVNCILSGCGGLALRLLSRVLPGGSSELRMPRLFLVLPEGSTPQEASGLWLLVCLSACLSCLCYFQPSDVGESFGRITGMGWGWGLCVFLVF